MDDLPYGFNNEDFNFFANPNDNFNWGGFGDLSGQYGGLTESDLNYFSQSGDNFDLTSYLNGANDPFNPNSGSTGINWANLGSQAAGALNSVTQNPLLQKLYGMAGGAYGIANQLDWQELLKQGRDLGGKRGAAVANFQPYAGDTVAGLSEAQKQAIGYAPGLLSQAQPWLGEGAGMVKGSANYDPSQIQNYLNPYTEGALSAANRLTTQNLNENILPEINSTFTGQGQFGGTRNAEFQNRAIRDTQQAIANANAAGMVGAYGQASGDYMDMLKQQGIAGQQLGQMGITGLEAGTTLGGLAQANEQAQLTGKYDQWKTNQTMPMDLFKTWGGAVSGFNPAGTGIGGTTSAALAGVR
jgi:hypothetical protein